MGNVFTCHGRITQGGNKDKQGKKVLQESTCVCLCTHAHAHTLGSILRVSSLWPVFLKWLKSNNLAGKNGHQALCTQGISEHKVVRDILCPVAVFIPGFFVFLVLLRFYFPLRFLAGVYQFHEQWEESCLCTCDESLHCASPAWDSSLLSWRASRLIRVDPCTPRLGEESGLYCRRKCVFRDRKSLEHSPWDAWPWDQEGHLWDTWCFTAMPPALPAVGCQASAILACH